MGLQRVRHNSEWMTNEFFYHLSGCAQSYWVTTNFLSCTSWLNHTVLFSFSTPKHNTWIWRPKCKYHLVLSRPLQALTLLQNMPALAPVSAFHECDQPVISVLLQAPEHMEPCSWSQQIAIRIDTCLVTLCLVIQARCKTTWPQCYWPTFLQLACENTVQDSMKIVRCFTEIQNTTTRVL